jgi:hypothetical protein
MTRTRDVFGKNLSGENLEDARNATLRILSSIEILETLRSALSLKHRT